MQPSPRNRLIQLFELLSSNGDLFRERPFVSVPLSWESRLPALSKALRRLDPETVAQFENRPLEIPAVRNACGHLVDALERLSAWPTLDTNSIPHFPMPKRIGLKKWHQIMRFTAVLARYTPPRVGRFVDWCSGKGHLGSAVNRALSRPVTCVEKDGALCEIGAAEAAVQQADLRFVRADVLTDDVSPLFGENCGAIALHACGHLNIGLLERGIAAKVPFLAVAPCCYQRIDGMIHRPISMSAREYEIPMNRHLLRLPSLDDNLTGTSGRNKRKRDHAYRLGLDMLIRDATGVDEYHPLGSIKPGLFRQGFEHFATSVAMEKGLPLPTSVRWSAAEAAGWERYHLVSALSLSRALFRRAIESYLLLDRICFLEENGYRVEAGTFCPYDVTPRNIMVVAYRGINPHSG